ncbi:hypothetical protein Vretimale_6484 [Volvox reticuliferus]|uniref:Heterokaryon incompatibility domain-containing protein n=1 Tax=Volvox reticuliferus TaxID=1737510 RepID=A0A8J4CYS9_9CHLO|nr:hypothetical protein Vretifemale_19993 [Volvox reticuliferus]GIM01698.1 hypothetical protein Vretimale_6484 [Volvox reticuliferus]
MGCGASVDSNASQAKVTPMPLPPRAENVLACIQDNRPLDDLPDCVADLHYGMPALLKQAPMRLLKINNVLAWTNLRVYEEVPPSACLNLPYAEVDDALWDQTAVLSWRWGAPKPSKLQHGYSPMLQPQFTEFCEVLTRLRDNGIQYVWIDWCCVPQYSSSPMVEIMRSKVFYMRARAMVIIPTFHPIPPEGIVRLLLVKAARSLRKRGHKSLQGAAAADVINSILAREQVAGREYFSRVWTLAERMARHGRSEQLCNWLSLEAWLGMVVDAMLKSTDDKTASQIYKKILGTEAGDLLDKILDPLAAAVKTGSMLVAEGLEEMVAQLFEMAVNMWKSQSILEEAPTKPWLLSYLEEAHTGVYQAWNEGDRVWAVYSYFCWKQLDQLQPTALLEALQDLARVAGAHRRHMVGLAKRLGIDKLLPVEEMDERLMKAAEVGDVAMVLQLIEQGANTQLSNEKEDNVTALFLASQKGHLDVVKALLAAGAPINGAKTSGCAPLHTAAMNGHVEILAYLLERGAEKEVSFHDGATPLYVAAEKGKVECLQKLIDAGANKNVKLKKDGHTPLCISVLNHNTECVRALLAGGADKNLGLKDGATPLYLAGEKGFADCIKLLVDAKANTELGMESGATPLYIASQNNFPECVDLLIKAGANKNASRKDKATPLYIASERGHIKVVNMLLEAGANIECTFQSGATPIYVAAQNNRVEVVNALMAKGANKLIKLKGGYTPIHSAALAGHVDVIKALVEGGVDKNVTLEDGATPLYLAAEKGHVEAVKFLLELGADKTLADNNGKKPKDVAKSSVSSLL